MGLNDEDKKWIATQLTINAAAAKAANDGLKTSLTAAIERVETSLLTELHKWAGPMEQRMNSHRAAIRTLDLEGEQLKERIEKLEPPRKT